MNILRRWGLLVLGIVFAKAGLAQMTLQQQISLAQRRHANPPITSLTAQRGTGIFVTRGSVTNNPDYRLVIVDGDTLYCLKQQNLLAKHANIAFASGRTKPLTLKKTYYSCYNPRTKATALLETHPQTGAIIALIQPEKRAFFVDANGQVRRINASNSTGHERKFGCGNLQPNKRTQLNMPNRLRTAKPPMTISEFKPSCFILKTQIVVDYFTYNQFGEEALEDYVLRLHAFRKITDQVSDLDQFELEQILFFDTKASDPSFDEYSGIKILETFQKLLQTRITLRKGDLSEIISSKQFLDVGGVAATIGGLHDRRMAYCISGYMGNLPERFDLNRFNWDVMVFVHEVGHLRNLPHTFSCLEDGGPALECYSGRPYYEFGDTCSCPKTNPPLPYNYMSYASPFISLALALDPRQSNQIKQYMIRHFEPVCPLIDADCNLSAQAADIEHNRCFGGQAGRMTVKHPSGSRSGRYEYAIAQDQNQPQQWQPNPIFTNLRAGFYGLWLRDAQNPSCFARVQSFGIAQPDTLNIKQFSRIEHIYCLNANQTGSFSLLEPNPNPNDPNSVVLQFDWGNQPGSGSNPRKDLPGGTYTVTITDLQCGFKYIHSFKVLSPEPFTLKTDVQQNCDGTGQLTATPTGGNLFNSYYFYFWRGPNGFMSYDSSITASQSGLYTVSVIPCFVSNLELTRSFRITPNPMPIVKTLTVVGVSGRTVSLKWQPVRGMMGYIIRYRRDNYYGNWEWTELPMTTATELTVTGLSPYSTYMFQIATVNLLAKCTSAFYPVEGVFAETLPDKVEGCVTPPPPVVIHTTPTQTTFQLPPVDGACYSLVFGLLSSGTQNWTQFMVPASNRTFTTHNRLIPGQDYGAILAMNCKDCTPFNFANFEKFTPYSSVITWQTPAPRQSFVNDRHTDLKLYPNPNQGHFTVSFVGQNEPVYFSLTDVTGKVVYEQTAPPAYGEQTLTINADSLPTGIYQAKVVVGQSVHQTRVAIK